SSCSRSSAGAEAIVDLAIAAGRRVGHYRRFQRVVAAAADSPVQVFLQLFTTSPSRTEIARAHGTMIAMPYLEPKLRYCGAMGSAVSHVTPPAFSGADYSAIAPAGLAARVAFTIE